jgi:hypothetical protein
MVIVGLAVLVIIATGVLGSLEHSRCTT